MQQCECLNYFLEKNNPSSVASQLIFFLNVNKNIKIIITHKFYKKINIMIVNISGKYWEIWNEIPYLHHA